MSKAAILKLDPILPLRKSAYDAIKDAISRINIYSSTASLRLDERRLAESLGISRTPVREAISQLQKEGLLETHSRSGTYIVRKSKREIIDSVYLWAGIEGVAARLVTEKASNEEIASLRHRLTVSRDSSDAHAEISMDEPV